MITILFLGQATTSEKPPNFLHGLQKLGFNTLADMMANSGVHELLMSDAEITLFAPTDGSIQEFLNNQPVTPPSTEDKDALKNLLLNHIVQRIADRLVEIRRRPGPATCHHGL